MLGWCNPQGELGVTLDLLLDGLGRAAATNGRLA